MENIEAIKNFEVLKIKAVLTTLFEKGSISQNAFNTMMNCRELKKGASKGAAA